MRASSCFLAGGHDRSCPLRDARRATSSTSGIPAIWSAGASPGSRDELRRDWMTTRCGARAVLPLAGQGGGTARRRPARARGRPPRRNPPQPGGRGHRGRAAGCAAGRWPRCGSARRPGSGWRRGPAPRRGRGRRPRGSRPPGCPRRRRAPSARPGHSSSQTDDPAALTTRSACTARAGRSSAGGRTVRVCRGRGRSR